ncbi:hypothetical protein NXW96_22165 [Bacteroides fragilis]|nr:hypothetical protein [Bacteroides fragilis]
MGRGIPETEIVDAYISTAHIAGSLQISHFGHGCTFLLVGMEMKKDIFGLMDELIIVDLYQN